MGARGCGRGCGPKGSAAECNQCIILMQFLNAITGDCPFGYKSRGLQSVKKSASGKCKSERTDSNSLILAVAVMKVQVAHWLPLIFFLLVSGTPRVAGSWRSEYSRQDPDPKTRWGNQLPDMLVAYYRHHGVHSLMLVVCHTDIGELTLCMQCAAGDKFMTPQYTGQNELRKSISHV